MWMNRVEKMTLIHRLILLQTQTVRLAMARPMIQVAHHRLLIISKRKSSEDP